MMSEAGRAGVSVSVVAPCFNEEQGLKEFWRRTADACRSVAGDCYEIVLVDDGSRDRTWRVIGELSRQDPHVVGVRLFRNHGHQLAASAGLSVSRGARVMLIDADLQDPPELLAEMMALMDEGEGADVVYGERISRDGESRFKLVTASLFYRLLGKLSAVNIPRNTGDFRLMTRSVVDALGLMPEHHRFLRGMISWIGGRQVPLRYDRAARFAGDSKYPFRKMLRFAIDAITSFSIVPLRLAVWLGIAVSGLAFLLLFYVAYRWVTHAVVPGWASSLIATSLFAGTQLLVLGIIGEYLGKLVEELKGRPLFLIGEVCVRGRGHAVPSAFSRYEPSRQQDILDKMMPPVAVAGDRADRAARA